MTHRLWPLSFAIAVGLALLVLLVPGVTHRAADTVLAATACGGNQFFVYKGTAGTGGVGHCALKDFPLVRTPQTGNNLTASAGYTWPDGTSMDNTASSYAWNPGAVPGVRMRLHDGYTYTGAAYDFIRPSVGSGPYNFAAINNRASSFTGCGTTCSDEP